MQIIFLIKYKCKISNVSSYEENFKKAYMVLWLSHYEYQYN